MKPKIDYSKIVEIERNLGLDSFPEIQDKARRQIAKLEKVREIRKIIWTFLGILLAIIVVAGTAYGIDRLIELIPGPRPLPAGVMAAPNESFIVPAGRGNELGKLVLCAEEGFESTSKMKDGREIVQCGVNEANEFSYPSSRVYPKQN